MAVISLKETWTGSPATAQSSTDGSGSVQVQRKFTATTNNLPVPDISLDVLNYALTPKQNSRHPWSPYFRCENVTATPTSPITFDVVATYKAESSDPEDNPLNEPAEVTFSSSSVDGAVDEDINGDPIVTVNGEPINGVTMPFADLEANVSGNVASFDPLVIYEYVNTVNSTTYLGFSPGVVRLAKISAQKVNGEDLTYWKISVTFQFRKPINTSPDKAWWVRVRHEGFLLKETDPSTGGDIYVPKLDENGKEATKPVMINISDGTEETSPEVGHWIEFEVMEEKNFNNLGINFG